MKTKALLIALSVFSASAFLACSDESNPASSGTGSSVTNSSIAASSANNASSTSSECRSGVPNANQCTPIVEYAWCAPEEVADPVGQMICDQYRSLCADPNPASCPELDFGGGDTTSLSSSTIDPSSSSIAQSSSAADPTCTSKQKVLTDACVEVCDGGLMGSLGAPVDAERIGTDKYRCICENGSREGPGGGYWPSFDLPLCFPF